MDSDIALTNTSILLEDFIHKFPADARIAFTDGLEGFNAGAFFIKNDPWSYWLLDAWWNASEPNPGAKCTASKDAGFMFHRCKFQWNDQVRPRCSPARGGWGSRDALERRGPSEAAPEAVRLAVGGGC